MTARILNIVTSAPVTIEPTGVTQHGLPVVLVDGVLYVAREVAS